MNLSRNGFYFETSAGHYYAGMQVDVTRNFDPRNPVSHEEVAGVVRVEKLSNGKFGVAIRILSLSPSAPPRPSLP